MKILTTFMYIFSLILTWSGLGYVIYSLKNPALPKKLLKGINDIDFFKSFGNLKQSVTKKRSVVLIYFAQKGYIKIRQDEEGNFHIDKLRDFEDIEAYKEVLETLYKGKISYYGDEDAIMSYESVAWDDVKASYSNSVDSIVEKIKSSTKSDDKKVKDKKRKHIKIDFVLFVNWVFCTIPIAITYAMKGMSDKWASVFAWYFVLGIMYIAGKGLLKVNRSLGAFISVWTDSKLDFFSAFIVFIAYIFRIMVWFVLLGITVFSVALFAVAGELGVGTVDISILLEVSLVVVSIILLFIKWKYNDPVIDLDENEQSIKNVLKEKNIKKLKTREEREKIALYASMFNKVKEFEKVRTDREEKPDWYEGEIWKGVDELILQLDTK